MASVWLEHGTKTSEREQKMTWILHDYLFVQSAKPRPSQTPAVSSLDMVPSLGSHMFTISTNDKDDSQPSRRRGDRGLENEDGREYVTWGVKKSVSKQLTYERRSE